MGIEYLAAGQGSWWSRLVAVSRRLGLGHALTGTWVALLVLIAAHIGMVLVEQQAARRELLPPHYLLLRWGFTVVAIAMMVTVLTLRLLGQTIKF